jgi:hypothetical protein
MCSSEHVTHERERKGYSTDELNDEAYLDIRLNHGRVGYVDMFIVEVCFHAGPDAPVIPLINVAKLYAGWLDSVARYWRRRNHEGIFQVIHSRNIGDFAMELGESVYLKNYIVGEWGSMQLKEHKLNAYLVDRKFNWIVQPSVCTKLD